MNTARIFVNGDGYGVIKDDIDLIEGANIAGKVALLPFEKIHRILPYMMRIKIELVI